MDTANGIPVFYSSPDEEPLQVHIWPFVPATRDKICIVGRHSGDTYGRTLFTIRLKDGKIVLEKEKLPREKIPNLFDHLEKDGLHRVSFVVKPFDY